MRKYDMKCHTVIREMIIVPGEVAIPAIKSIVFKAFNMICFTIIHWRRGGGVLV